jgi:hypothetical protein
VAAELSEDHISYLYAGYWVAYVLSFESRGRIIATDPYYARNPAFVAAVAAHDSAWLFVDPADRRLAREITDSSLLDPGCAVLTNNCLVAGELESYLTKRHIAYTVLTVAPFVAVVPTAPLDGARVIRAYDVPGPSAT